MTEWILLTAAMLGGGDDWRSFAPAPTLLGMSCWSDAAIGANWRLRMDSTSGVFRLQDAAGKLLAKGTERECRAVLAKRIESGEAKPLKGKVVLMLHGIFRTRRSLEYFAKGFREAGYEAAPVDYASCHMTIERHADMLRGLVAELKEAEEISFVCHSMGGLVTRAYLAEKPDPRIKRVVLLGTPNHGSEKADFFRDWGLYGYLFGPSGRQLTTDAGGLTLAPPPPGIEFGVIAGGTGKSVGYSLMLPGDNDGTVSVASARLEGSRDFVLVPSRHTFLASSPKNREMAIRFIREGSFQGEDKREAVTAAANPPRLDAGKNAPAKAPPEG
jgi:pimeloyl-ACP methyl ester carboxylesterase